MPDLSSRINEIRYRLSGTLSHLPLYTHTRAYYNRLRGSLWERNVLQLRNQVRTAARQKGLRYSASEVTKQILQRTLAKKLTPKPAGQLRIFTAYDSKGWVGDNIQPTLAKLGTVIHFELDNPFAQQGNPYTWFRTQRQTMNARLLQTLTEHHTTQPIDVFFGYVSGLSLTPETIIAINNLGIATLNMSLDDMSGLANKMRVDGFDAGIASIAPYFDMSYTSTLAACEEYLLLDARPYYLSMGANPNVYRRLNLKRDIPIAFFGQRHGIRAALVNDLARKGLTVQTFGTGWQSDYLPIEKIIELINRTEIVLGHGHHASWGDSSTVRVTCLKGRDFEIPMCGALYLTTFDPELQLHFDIGKEIVCYRTVDDLYDTITYLLSNPDKMGAIREAGWQRAHAQHTWQHHFEEFFHVLGVLE